MEEGRNSGLTWPKVDIKEGTARLDPRETENEKAGFSA
jgi:hypothetical protein